MPNMVFRHLHWFLFSKRHLDFFVQKEKKVQVQNCYFVKWLNLSLCSSDNINLRLSNMKNVFEYQKIYICEIYCFCKLSFLKKTSWMPRCRNGNTMLEQLAWMVCQCWDCTCKLICDSSQTGPSCWGGTVPWLQPRLSRSEHLDQS